MCLINNGSVLKNSGLFKEGIDFLDFLNLQRTPFMRCSFLFPMSFNRISMHT